nr:histone deacetylase 14 [Tanacetum cinerariifolium]
MHRFHPRPDSLLYLSNEEPVLGYLKFIAKGTKREIFGMPIPGRLITANIQAAPYYQEYLENVAKHRGFLAGETRSTQDLPTPRPAKPTRKSYVSRNTRRSRGSPKSVGESEAEEVPAQEPQGPLPPVVIREPESGKYQPLPEVPGKGKAKVSEEQVAHDLLSLQKHKKTSPADQYIFQRRVSEPIASSFLDVSPYEVLGQLDSEEESEKVMLRVEKSSQDEGQAGPDPNAQAEGQTGSDTGAQAEGQAGSNPDETSKGQAGSNPDESSKGQAGPDPGNAKARVQFTSSPMVHARSDREHMDTDVANVSLQPSTEQLYEGFTVTIYPNVQENLKLAVEEPVLLEEPASSPGTLSSL